MTSTGPGFSLAFPRHKPQFFGNEYSDLAVASRYYAFGRSRHRISRWALEMLVRTPIARDLVVTRAPFTPPHDESTWRAFMGRIEQSLPVASVVAYQSQWRAQRYALLIVSPERKVAGFAQVRPIAEHYPLPAHGAWSFRSPDVLADLTLGDWELRLFSPLPPYHRPLPEHDDRIDEIAHDASHSLSTVLDVRDRPHDHWVAAHGDLTPWNVRVDASGDVWLIDWEQAAWAPPAADLLRFLLSVGTLQGEGVDTVAERIVGHLGDGPDVQEAADYWLAHEFYSTDATEWERKDMEAGKTADLQSMSSAVAVLRRLTR